MPNRHQFIRKIFPKKDVVVIDRDIFSFDDVGNDDDDDDNDNLNETIKSIIDNLLPVKIFKFFVLAKSYVPLLNNLCSIGCELVSN